MPNKNFMSSFFDKRRRKPNPAKLSRKTIAFDRYDKQDAERMLKDMPDFDAHREKLADSKAGELAYDVWQDGFLALHKFEAEDIPEDQIRPTHLINRVVMDEARDLSDFKELRQWTQGDDIGSALAMNTIEPHLETIYDRLEEETEMAKQLMQQMQALSQMQDEEKNLDDMIKEWTEEHEGEEDDEGQQGRKEKQKELQDAIQEAEDGVSQGAQELKDALNGKRPGIKAEMQKGMEKAADNAETMNAMAESFGMEPGSLHRLPANKRLELAKRMDNPKFKKIAELFGPMKRLAFTEQRRKVNYAPEEIFDVELGNNLNRVLPTEVARLSDPLRKVSFLKDFVQRGLMQYKMRGYEKVAKGGIVYVFDGSGSMAGDREIWSKAVGLALLHIAKKQNRPFYAIQFGSRNEINVFDFRDSQNFTPEDVIDFAEFFFNGGTDFMSPLNTAVGLLNDEYNHEGRTKSDIVFATDGYCSVTDDWLVELKKAQDKIGFQIWGINIGGDRDAEPLHSICDGKVASIQSLTNGDNVRQIFGGV